MPFSLELLGVDQRSWSAAAQLKSEARIRPSRHPVVFFFQVDLERSLKCLEASFAAGYSVQRMDGGPRPAASELVFLCGN